MEKMENHSEARQSCKFMWIVSIYREWTVSVKSLFQIHMHQTFMWGSLMSSIYKVSIKNQIQRKVATAVCRD